MILGPISPEDAMERIHLILSHAWMVRTFLKHADEFEGDPELMSIPRAIFDFIRALEGSYRERDASRYLKRTRRRLNRLRDAIEFFEEEQPHISDHTNFQQALLSIQGCLLQIQEILNAVDSPVSADAADAGRTSP